MKNLVFTGLIWLCLSTVYGRSLPRPGASVPIIFTQEVSSKNPSVPVILVAEDLVDAQNKVIVLKGTPVTFSHVIIPAKRVGKPGVIDIRFLSVTSIYGTTIPLTGNMRMEGESIRKKVLGIGIGMGILIHPMLLYLLKKGEDVIIPVNAKSVAPKIAPNAFEQ
jgi:hypothetical protein